MWVDTLDVYVLGQFTPRTLQSVYGYTGCFHYAIDAVEMIDTTNIAPNCLKILFILTPGLFLVLGHVILY